MQYFYNAPLLRVYDALFQTTALICMCDISLDRVLLGLNWGTGEISADNDSCASCSTSDIGSCASCSTSKTTVRFVYLWFDFLETAVQFGIS